MEVIRFWSVVLVLLSIHGGSDSTTETMVTDFSTFTGVTLQTVMPTARTPPPPPPSIPPPPPTFDTVDPTPEPTPTPPSGTRTPPPPPPPSPPPPPPSSIAPPLTTPPPTEFATTVAIEPTRRSTNTPEPTEPRQTEPRATEPNPTEGSDPNAEEMGKISVVVEGSKEEFDQQNFKEVIAEQTNMYCLSNEGACKGGTLTVGPEDVIIVAVTDYEDPVASSRRRRLLATQTQVDYYVRNPIDSSNVMLTSEQQEAFLTDEEVVQNLEENIGFAGMPAVVTEPPPTLEPWAIALIVIGSVAGLALVAGGIGYYMSRSKKPADELDLELQQKLPVEEFTDVREGNDYSTVPASNGGSELPKKKAPVDEVDVSTQVKYNEILSETGYTFAKQQAADDGANEPSPAANGGNSIVVTAEISSSSSSSTSSQHDESEQIATADDQQVIPPEYEEVQEKAAETSKPTAPANDAAPQEESTKTADQEAAEAVSELTNLVAEAKGEESGHDNPGFSVTTEVDEHNIAKTAL
ncbi:uncharacterized protein [Diadema antillarum]|uniref:uncharacterized protein n=1 Tax=Diadema antillarum TaxID=105358 RepID=UPI003A892B38